MSVAHDTTALRSTAAPSQDTASAEARPSAHSGAPQAHLQVAAPSLVPSTLAAGLTCRALDGRVVEHANLDHAASAPVLAAVKQAVDIASQTYASVHRGKGYASQISSGSYEAAREEVARYVGAREDDIVIFTRNTTDSMNLLARALPTGTVVFVYDSEHHATLLPWPQAQTARLPVPYTVRDAEVSLEDALSTIPAEHRLVVLTAASNVTGELWPLERLTRIARDHGARVVIDAAQLAPHRPVDLESLGADWVAFSGHKLYAPFGAGVLAGRRDWLDRAEPYLAGGGATQEVSPLRTSWHRGAARHEGGSPNVLGAVALAAACATFRRHGEAIEAHESALFARLREGLAGIDGVRTYSIFGEDHERVPVITFTIEGLEADLVATALSLEHGIGVRDGRFCAHLLVDELLRREGSDAPAAVRVSLGLGNRLEHVERLIAAVRSLAANGPSRRYTRDAEGAWRADGHEVVAAPSPW
ncbi:aminotransferase class V-fold PLP-dependent enzyme [Janibacter sp. GXQ6167]|uniref:aminotransferase class V-fold PLP-dependent enzyme n=1 Tax=Janibacter sp. GXQ6167 TaxID=3240791 RepID=UPI0035232449